MIYRSLVLMLMAVATWCADVTPVWLGPAPGGSGNGGTPGGAAGGDLGGTYPNPTVVTIPNHSAAKVTSGTLAVARGGTGVDGSAAANGQLLVGNGTGYSLADLNGNGVVVTTGAGTLGIGVIARTVFNGAGGSLAASNASTIVAAQTGSLAAPITITLPAANAITAGARVFIIDESRSVTGTNTITIARAGSDTIAGGTSYVMTRADQPVVLISDGTSKWSLASADSLPTYASGWLKNNGTTPSWSAITSSDVTGLGTMATQNATAVAITGGAVDGTTVGATTAAAGKFTTITATPGAGATALTLTGGTQTTSFPVISATQTWNAGGVTFTGQLLNVTNTASAAASLLFDYQIAGVSMLSMSKTQLVLLGPTVTTSQPVLSVTQDANAAGVTFTIFKVNLTGTAASGSLLMDLQTAGASECNVTRTGSMTLAGNITLSSGTATVGGLVQANTNTAASGALTSVGKFTESSNPAGSSTAINAAVWGTMKTLAANAQNNTAAAPGGTIGIEADATHAGTGTLTAMSALTTAIATTNSSGTVTSAHSIYVQTGTKAGGTTITTNYGVYIADQTIGTTNYSLYSGTGGFHIGGIPEFYGTNSTGGGTATIGAANCPAVTAAAVYTWITVVSADGSTCFVPAWK